MTTIQLASSILGLVLSLLLGALAFFVTRLIAKVETNHDTLIQLTTKMESISETLHQTIGKISGFAQEEDLNKAWDKLRELDKKVYGLEVSNTKQTDA